MATYYAQRASAGLIVTEGTQISPQGQGYPGTPGIFSPEQIDGWRHVTEQVFVHRGRIFSQLWHVGRISHPLLQPNGALPVAPSALAPAGKLWTQQGMKEFVTPHTLETSEIAGIVEDYRKAAANALAAGFDGVELHAANGYLIDQFLQSKTNRRTDEYGGSVENRYRFLKEVVEAVTSVWPAQRVGVHLSPNSPFNDMGSPDYREQFTFVAGQLDRFGLAYLHVVDGLAFGFHNLGEPMTLAEFRKVFHGPLVGNCGYTKETAEKAIAEGHADLISFGRPFISNPDLVERFRNGWPLAEPAPMSDWSSPSAGKGYTDFPAYAPQHHG
jgi:2,4-dienoyl-CoA reductase-like NADH-dependent reductase (Old Yellow Enzyme family)